MNRPDRYRRPAVRRPSRAAALVAALVVAGAAALAACGQTANDTRSATAGLPDLGQSLQAHQWLLDASDSSISATGAAAHPVTLVFTADDAASGTAGCNTYRAHVTLEGDDSVRFEHIAASSKTCPPPVMDVERAFLDALDRVRTADATDRSRLVLKGGGARLAFSKFDVSEKIVGAWEIVNVATTGGLESVVAGTTPTAVFHDDRSLVVRTGCNTLRTGWRLDGEEIRFDPPAQTSKLCDEPTGVMEQEVALASAVTRAASVELTPTSLTLLDGDGSIVLIAKPAPRH